MATAFRVNEAPEAEPPAMTGCVGIGDFGRRVANLLAATVPGTRRFPGPAEALDAGAGILVVASWRPSPALYEQADELAFKHQRPWLPVIMEHPVIRVGPWVAPPAAPCYACYQSRRAQHDDQRETTRLLHDAYDRDECCGPAGFLPHHARAAAEVAQSMLAAAERGTQRPGQVITVRLARLEVSADQVVPVHACPRCSPPGSAPERDLSALFRLPQAVPAP